MAKNLKPFTQTTERSFETASQTKGFVADAGTSKNSIPIKHSTESSTIPTLLSNQIIIKPKLQLAPQLKFPNFIDPNESVGACIIGETNGKYRR